jgi:hypothetical protein
MNPRTHYSRAAHLIARESASDGQGDSTEPRVKERADSRGAPGMLSSYRAHGNQETGAILSDDSGLRSRLGLAAEICSRPAPSNAGATRSRLRARRAESLAELLR